MTSWSRPCANLAKSDLQDNRALRTFVHSSSRHRGYAEASSPAAKGFHTMQITWFGHSAFRLDFAGNAVLIDPFFTGNPAFVSDKAAASKGVSQIVLTHGHGDHVGDTLDIAKQNGATVTTN